MFALIYMFQLSELITVGPTAKEIWDYFSDQIVPVINMWQMERANSIQDDPKAVINKWIADLLQQLEANETTITQVYL